MRNRLLNLLALNAKRGSFAAKDNEILIYDAIVSSEIEAEFFGGVTPMQVRDALKGMTGKVTMRINSPGGDVFAANVIVQAMREYDGEIEAIVDGVAASAASVVAVAASKVTMAQGSMMMIHNAWTITVGDRHGHLETAELLEKVDGQLADHYAERTKRDSGDIASMMDAETWMTAEEAVEGGFADAVYETKKKAKAMWDLSAYENAPAAQSETPKQEIEARARKHAAAMLLKAA